VCDHGEELEAALLLVGHSLLLELLELDAVLAACGEEAEVGVEVDGECGEEDVEDLGGEAEPEGWVDDDFEGCLVAAPGAVVVGGVDSEGVGAGGEVVVECAAVGGVDPVAVVAFEDVGVSVFLWGDVAEGREEDAEGVLVVAEVDAACVGDGLWELLGSGAEFFGVDVDAGDADLGWLLVELYFCGSEGGESVCGSEEEASVVADG